MLTMMGLSMQFHFGEYVVSHLGYGVDTLGWITGIGAVGSIFLRPYAGTWIDRVGCRPCFVASALVAAVGSLSFQFVEALWLISLLRVLTTTANATFLTTVAVYAAQAAPPERRAESLGTVGIGGFLGMMAGPAIGDAIFSQGANTPEAFGLFFTVVAGASLLAGVVVCNLRSTSPKPHAAPPFGLLVRRHWPGMIMVLPVVFCAILTIHMTFLERFAHTRGFDDIRWFFLVYCPTAIVLRVTCRRLPERVGRERLCVVGLSSMAVGLLLLIPVHAEWQLVLPALFMGAGHCFVFPSMVDLVAEAMPLQHRGVGTSLALGAGDLGFLLGSVAWGQAIDLTGYVPTFCVAATITWVAVLVYLRSRRGQRSSLHATAAKMAP